MAKLKSGTRVYGDAQVDSTLTVGNITISGNLVVTGTTTSVNSTVTQLQDPIFELGGGANGEALLSDDTKERGILMHYWNGSADTKAYMGWHTSNAQFEFGAATTETSGNITVGTYGNVKAFHFIGEGDTLGNITGANVTGWVAQANYANFAGQVVDATQSNITLLGTQTSLTVSGTSNLAIVNANGITTLSNATTSTSTTSGALVVTGGVGIGGNLHVGGTLYANISGSTSAPGANTQVAFNDDGTTNATAGFTFNKSSNTVSTTALVLSGAANVGTDINMTNATATIAGTTLTVDASTELKTEGGSSNVTLSTSGAVIATTGGNVTINNDGNLTLSAGALKVNSNASITNDGTASVLALNATGSGSAGTANVGSAIIRDLAEFQVPFADGDKRLNGSSSFKFTTGTGLLEVGNVTLTGTANAADVIVTSLGDTRIPFANAGKALVDSANLTFNSTSNTLSVFNATLAGTANAAEVIVTSLTSTRVPFVDTDKSLTDDSTFTFASGKLSVGNIDVTGAVVAANLTSNNLTSGRVALAGTSGKLEDSTNLTFSGTVLTVTGNVAATNVLTDNLLYANGVAWDLQQAQGNTGEIQFNDSGDFTASANLSFNTTGNIVTTDSLQLNANANVGNATVRSLTTGRITFAGTNSKLEDSANLTFGSSNLTVTGNVVMSGAANITGANYFSATTANVVTLNASGNANVGVDLLVSGNANVVGSLKAGDTTIAGNLTVTGTTTSVNTTVSQLSDPLLDLGNGADGAALASDDGMDRGLVMHIYEGGVQDLFMGWDNSASEFVLAKNVTVVDNVVTVNGSDAAEIASNLADLRLSNIYAYNANFGGVVFSNGNVTLGSGSSFVGNLSGDVTGNISGNITVTGGAGAIQYANAANSLVSNANLNFDDTNLTFTVGDGSTTGEVIATLLTGTLTTASQPNVTSVGTLSSLSIDGNISGFGAGNGILTDNLFYANGDPWDLQQAAGSNGEIQFNSNGDFSSSANLTFVSNTLTVTGNANITSNLFTQTATVSSLTATRVTYAGTSGKLVDDSAFTFGSGKLTVGNVEMSGTANAAEVIITSLTATRVPFVDTDKSLTDDANLTFASNELKVTGTANVTSTLTAANVIVTSLTGGRVTFAATADDSLIDSENLTFDTDTNTLTTVTANVTTLNGTTANLSGNIFGANVYANSGTVKATYLEGTLTTAAQPNVTSVGTLTSLSVSGTSNLNAISNVTITGGSAGQIIQTDGAGVLSFVSNDTTRIINGTSNVSIPTADGNINMVAGGTTVVEVSGTGANVTGVVNVSGNIQGNNITALANITASGTTDATTAATGTIKTEGGISAKGNVYAGKAVGFAVGGGNTASAAYIEYNSTSGSLDFIFN